MKKISYILILSAFVFSGCFDFYLDFIQVPNGSYRFVERLAVGPTGMRMLEEVSQKAYKTPEIQHRAIIDSLKAEYERDKPLLDTLPGFAGYTVTDSTADTTTIVSAILSLNGRSAFRHFCNTSLPALIADKFDPMLMPTKTVTNGKSMKISFDLTRTPRSMTKDGSSDLAPARKIFAGKYLHIRVFADNMQQPSYGSGIEKISGGEDWSVLLTDLLAPTLAKKYHADFTVGIP